VQPLAEKKIGVELEEVDLNVSQSRHSPLSLALSPGAGARGQNKNVCAAVRIWDQGPGPSEEISGRLFEPFVTDKPDGTGLGLAVARDIVEAHHGGIRWYREAGKTWFEATISEGAANPPAGGEG
jgi:nitrogen-specific signal transduction histidine kinase